MTVVKTFFAFAATVITGFLGGFDSLLYALVVFIVVDYVSGVLAAIVTHALNSDVGLRGIAKKVLLLILVGVAATLDGVTGLADPWIRTAVIWFLLANEGFSILENVARAGVPVPAVLTRILEQMRDKDGAKEVPK